MKRILEVGDRVKVNESYPVSCGVGLCGVVDGLGMIRIWPCCVMLDNGEQAHYKQSELDYIPPKTNQNKELVLVIDKTTLEVLHECRSTEDALEAIVHYSDCSPINMEALAVIRIHPAPKNYPRNKLPVESYNIAAKQIKLVIV